MAKKRYTYICRSCGAVHRQWYGKCPDCSEWDSLEKQELSSAAQQDTQLGEAASDWADPARHPEARPIGEVDEASYPRVPTGIGEFDRVLGGSESHRGIVPGSAILVGGDPGIGKSTLLLQAAHQLAEAGKRVLYCTSEESAQQTRLRASRLGAMADELYVLADTNLSRILEQVRRVEPAVVVIDSIQMIYKGDLDAAPGTVTQLRACCTELVYLAKARGCAVFLVGHVTKEGRLAGPRLLEHLVDTVIYFEGDRYHAHRVVRVIKNRFGTTQEVGLFEMTESGLAEVTDPSGVLAADLADQPDRRPGAVICPVLQGSRCLLVEVQALTATGFLGSAKRKTSGIDTNRLAMLIAVLEKRAEQRLADQDIFVSIVGGMKVIEPATDLAVTLAIAGAHLNRALDPLTCAIGEVGLGGELRTVSQTELRLREAARLGFKQIIAPPLPPAITLPASLTHHPVRSINQALSMLG